jgi:P27 family predicted phage terminase small subunit
MARPLIPIEQKIAEGKFNKTQAKKPSVTSPKWPPVPSHYSQIHKVIFKSVCEILDRMEQLDVADTYIIQMFVDAWVLRQQNLSIIEIEGLSYTSSINGATVHRTRPEFIGYVQLDNKILKYMNKLGLSPADRTQLSMIFNEEKTANEVVEGQIVNDNSNSNSLRMFN